MPTSSGDQMAGQAMSTRFGLVTGTERCEFRLVSALGLITLR